MSGLQASRGPTFLPMFSRAPDEIIENGLYLGGSVPALLSRLV